MCDSITWRYLLFNYERLFTWLLYMYLFVKK